MWPPKEGHICRMKCSIKLIARTMRPPMIGLLSVLLFTHLLVSGVHGQDAGADDGGGDTGGDGSDLAQGDPNLVNTPNKQGYGKDVATGIGKTTALKISPQDKTLAEQSVQAVFQFGVLVCICRG